jgi:hypothetical protein
MTNEELWKLYEDIRAERERIKAKRRAQAPIPLSLTNRSPDTEGVLITGSGS